MSSKLNSQLSSAIKILDSYDGTVPLVYHLKKFFAANRKYGSTDRKRVAALCYAYFRSGLSKGDTQEKILTGLFLSEHDDNEMLALIKPGLNQHIKDPVEAKLALLKANEQNLFPFLPDVSEEINKKSFALSHLNQPCLFLRARPGKHAAVLQKLNDAAVPYETIGESCLSLPNSFNAANLLHINKEVVIQDLNSQRVLYYLDELPADTWQKKPHAWDCCAASGGKSILLYDCLRGNVRLTVSDIRESIIVNLKERLAAAGISIHKSFVADLRKTGNVVQEQFDIVICDAPCTGSGTWSRTPEQLYYFNKKKIGEYAVLQQHIISNSIASLHSKGVYFYITCSVFKEENEVQVKFIQDNFAVKLVSMEYLKGYEMLADTMFVAVFEKI